MILKSIKNNTADLFEILTGRKEDHLSTIGQFKLHPSIVAPLKKMQDLAKLEIGSDLQLISSFRNFERQGIIWNEKAEGKRAVYDDNENIQKRSDFSNHDFIEKILRFSALPGASRHHWGTDIDIYDANELDKKDVQLLHSECINNGPFAKLHSWLDEKINSDDCFGFYRPYQDDLGGVSPEKWHLSHKPTSSTLYNSFTLEMFIKNIEVSNIAFKEVLLLDPKYYFDKYIQNINLT